MAPDRIEIDVLGQDQRRLLRGFKYPSEREREAVAEGLHGAFEHAEVVFGFWGTELHYALIDATAMGGNVPATLSDVAPHLKWIQLTSAGADRLLNSGFIEGGVTVTTVSGLHATPIGEFVLSAMLMFAKGAPQTMRAQLKHEWSRFAPRELYGQDRRHRRARAHRRGGRAAREGVRLPRHRDEAIGDGVAPRLCTPTRSCRRRSCIACSARATTSC